MCISRWLCCGGGERTSPKWTTRSWAAACDTTTTRTLSGRRWGNVTYTALSATYKVCSDMSPESCTPCWTLATPIPEQTEPFGFFFRFFETSSSLSIKHICVLYFWITEKSNCTCMCVYLPLSLRIWRNFKKSCMWHKVEFTQHRLYSIAFYSKKKINFPIIYLQIERLLTQRCKQTL